MEQKTYTKKKTIRKDSVIFCTKNQKGYTPEVKTCQIAIDDVILISSGFGEMRLTIFLVSSGVLDFGVNDSYMYLGYEIGISRNSQKVTQEKREKSMLGTTPRGQIRNEMNDPCKRALKSTKPINNFIISNLSILIEPVNGLKMLI